MEPGTTQKGFSDTVKTGARRFLRHEDAGLFLIMLGIIGVMAGITRGKTLLLQNVSNIWLQSATTGIAVIGQTFVIISGGIDVSIGGTALLVSIFGANLMTGQSGFPAAALAIMLLLGTGIGAINGLFVSRLGMPSLIVTLAMWRITEGFAFIICRGFTIRELPESIAIFGGGVIAGVPMPVIIFVAIAVVAYLVLNYTTFGRSNYAVGGSPTSAWLSGINVPNMLFVVYVISGFLAALSGLVMTSRVMSASLNSVMGLEIDSIAACVIGGISLAGGRGTIIGAILGTLILRIFSNGMNLFALDPAYQDVAKGGIILIAVAIDYIRRRR